MLAGVRSGFVTSFGKIKKITKNLFVMSVCCMGHPYVKSMGTTDVPSWNVQLHG